MKLARYASGSCLALLLSILAAAPRAQFREVSSPRIAPLQQEQTKWCWATSDVMIMRHFGRDAHQCQIVADKTGLPNCCANPSGCNVKGTSILGNGYAWQFKVTANEQTWDQIVGGINKNLPFQFVWQYLPSGSHVMVGSAYLYLPASRRKLVGINEPDGGYFTWVDYSAYVGRAGSYYNAGNHYEMQP